MSSSSESNYSDDDLVIDDEDIEQKCVRPDLKFHRFVVKVTESAGFNAFIMLTILLNALFMAIETDSVLKIKFRTVFIVTDEIFLAIYTLEFILKIYAEPIRYFYSSYNLFDLFVLVISYVQVILVNVATGSTNLSALRVLRALRTLRTLRTVSFVKGLQVLVTALLDTIRNSVLNVVLLLFLLMFLFSIMGYYFFGYKETNSDKENWGDLGSAMLTLFSYVTVDGWTDLQGRLDALDMAGSRFYTILFIFLGHFVFTNVFIALIIMNIHEATETYREEQIQEREQIIQKKKEYMIQRQHNEVRLMLEKQNQGQFQNFNEMVLEFKKTLRHDDFMVSVDLATNLTWLETYITTLDHEDNTMYCLQQLHFEMANILAIVQEQKLKERYGM
ncbi:cation channel sperm-associated protein 3-like [Anneissia japonica]|uniref:cation channel sperm-associated protein 3-like n=1 Tax=Anneissia japonica TaxID=1529436 RepID=UPI0014258560|nr:cation channel sperm-associated protein 3-like [Anneissia japonica]